VKPRCVAVVGAGIVGLSTAYALLQAGVERVVVFEQATVDHTRSASHGISRLLRFEYGTDAFYTHMVDLSLQRWHALERASGRTLYTNTGLLVLGNEDDGYTVPSYNVLRKMGVATEYLTQRACYQRFPQFDRRDYDFCTYTQEAGILHASTCLQWLKAAILSSGGYIQEYCTVMGWNRAAPHALVRLRLSTGDEFVADRVVLATGSWVHRLLCDLHLPVRLTRQYALYFSRLFLPFFRRGRFPAFIAGDLYGFPTYGLGRKYGSNWLKAASHVFGDAAQPDDPPSIAEHIITDVRQRLCRLIPALSRAELIHIDSCVYDVSADENFIIDHLPDDPRIVFATGLTGHGFKFGPLLGELLCNLVCEVEPVVSLEPFRLRRFTDQRLVASAGHYTSLPEVGAEINKQDYQYIDSCQRQA
jgi:monomeric sarcosine oxidase